MVTTLIFASEYVQNNLSEFVNPFCYLFLVFVCQHAVLSVPCSLLVTWEWADLLTRLCVMFSCVVVTFPYGVLWQVWYSIVSIPDISLLHTWTTFQFGHACMSY